MKHGPILMTALISAALVLGAVVPAPAAANWPRQQPQPGDQSVQVQDDVEQGLAEDALLELDEDGAALDAATDHGKPDKPTKPKGKCRDFRRPCKPKPLNLPGLPETITSYTTANGATSSAIPKWFYLFSALNTSGLVTESLVLTDNSGPGSFGNQLTIEPIQSGNRGQLWMAEPLGAGYAYLHSGRGNSLMLSYGGATSDNQSGCNSQWPAKNYPSQVNSPAGSGADTFQQWSYTKVATASINGETVQLVSIGNANCTSPDQGVLFVTNNAAVAGTQVDMGVFGAAPGNQWFAWPNYPLDAILSAPPMPFPTGTAEQQQFYDWVTLQLNVPGSCLAPNGIPFEGVRCEYTNLNANLSGYQTQMILWLNDPQPPATAAGVSVETVTAVTAQLNEELNDAIVVQNLFANFNQALTDLTLDNEIQVTDLISDALGTSNSDTVKGAAAAVAEGVVYTVLSAAGPVASVSANLMETAINAANAANGENFTAPFKGAASTLWQALSADFQTALTTTASNETVILTDWGKLQQVGELASATGPGSLEWSTDSTSTFTTQGARGYAVSVMQMLLPARYKMTRLATQGDNSLIDTNTNGQTVNPAPPSYAQYAQFIANQINANQQFASDGPVYNKFYISDGNGNFPSQQALQTDVWDNGGVPFDFFLGTNGWEGFRANGTDDQYLDCDGLITVITNWTNQSLSVASNYDIGYQGGNLYSLYTRDDVVYGYTDNVELELPPFATISFGSYYQSGVPNGLQFDFTIYANNGSTVVGSFDTHQHKCGGSDQTWIDNNAGANGFYLTNPNITTQSHSNPGVIEIGIYQPY